jgi:nucleoid-associated protein YgaU
VLPIVPEASFEEANTLTALRKPESESAEHPSTEEFKPPVETSEIATGSQNFTYTVGKGETLAGIAKKTTGKGDSRTIQAFIAANPKLKSRPNKVLSGETLKIPRVGAPDVGRKEAAASTADARKVSRSQSKSPSATKARLPRKAVVSREGAGKPAARTQWVTVKAKETLPAVAKRVLKDERRWREIQSLNGLKPNQKLTSGMKLKVPVSRET